MASKARVYTRAGFHTPRQIAEAMKPLVEAAAPNPARDEAHRASSVKPLVRLLMPYGKVYLS